MAPARCQAVVFDFDGVIVQSNALKRRAFYDIFPVEAAGAVDAVLAAHREKSRFAIIALILAAWRPGEHAPEAVDAPAVAGLAADYNRIVEQGAVDCPLIPGAGETLASLAGRLPLYIASATPQEPLRRIVAARGLAGRFRRVLGAPASKQDNLAAVVAEVGPADSAAVVMVGDGRSDLRAAQALGCSFIGIDNEFGTLRGLAPLRPDLIGLAAEIEHLAGLDPARP